MGKDGSSGVSRGAVEAAVHLMDGVVDGGVDLHVFRRGDPVSSYLKRGMIWHPPIVKVLAHLMRPGRVFVDVGAHIGLFAITAAKAAGGGGQVVAFEPDPVNREVLIRNAALNRVDLDIRDCAIAGQEGQATLFKSAENLAIHSIVPEPRLTASTVVRTSTLERQLSGLDRLDLIKLDVQGAEPEIIAGIGDFLFRFERAPIVILEVNPRDWVQRDPQMSALLAFIQRYRYDLHVLMSSEGVNLVPPPVTWNTFAAICNDFIRFGRGVHDLDIVLWPPARNERAAA